MNNSDKIISEITQTMADLTDKIIQLERRNEELTLENLELLQQRTKKITSQQMAWIHPVFREIAAECRVRGYTQEYILEHFFRDGQEVSEELIKFMFHEVMKSQIGKSSTTQLETTETSSLMETFLYAWEKRLNIHIAMPDEIPLTAYENET